MNHKQRYAKAWKESHPDYQSTWRKTNAAHVRDSGRAWRKANAEHRSAYGKAWRMAHPNYDKSARRRAAIRSWRVKNREHYLAGAKEATHLRRARIAKVLSTLTAQEWEAILEAAGHACIYCGSQGRLSQEHLIPISRGGPHTAGNVAPACRPCNLSKGAKTFMEFLAEEGTI